LKRFFLTEESTLPAMPADLPDVNPFDARWILKRLDGQQKLLLLIRSGELFVGALSDTWTSLCRACFTWKEFRKHFARGTLRRYWGIFK
jgi:hypothetical protein